MSDNKVTNYMVKLRNQLADLKLSDSSIDMYMSNLIRLNKDKSFNNLSFLKDKEFIDDYLNQYQSVETKLNYIKSATAALKTLRASPLYKTTIDYFKNHMAELSMEKDRNKSNDLKPREKENWLSWDNIITHRDKVLLEEIKPHMNSKTITKHMFEAIKDYVLLCLYTMIPPRRNRDFINCFILLKDNVPEKDIQDINTIDMVNDELVFRDYKTKAHHGIQKVDLPQDLKDVLTMYIKHHPEMKGTKKPNMIRLLVNYTGTPCTAENYITKKLNSIFQRKISSTMLRHIYLTEKYGDAWFKKLHEMEKDAQAMGHTPEMQKEYLRDIDSE